MIYGFLTKDRELATAALVVYATWVSRDRQRFKISPTVWAQVEGFVKAAAKRAATVADFLDRLKPRLACGTLRPDSFAVVADDDGRQFYAINTILEEADDAAVLEHLYRRTSHVILLVRNRLEDERAIEAEAAPAFSPSPAPAGLFD